MIHKLIQQASNATSWRTHTGGLKFEIKKHYRQKDLCFWLARCLFDRKASGNGRLGAKYVHGDG